tara:strand:- start:872 stop:2359 length:1488 start_codon:yes stop_codon:yes gene_type:complete
MSKDLTETLAKLSDRNLPKEEADALLATLEGKDLLLEVEFQRHNTTLSISAPEEFRRGQTLNGKAGQREVQVLLPESDEVAVRALTYGTELSLVVRYLEFDDFYRRATFTGTLQSNTEESEAEPAPDKPKPEPEPEATLEPEAEPEPEPVAEKEKPLEAEEDPAEPVPETIEQEDASDSIAPPLEEPAKTQTGELAVFSNPDLPEDAGSTLVGKSSVSSADLIAAIAQETESSAKEAALAVDGFWDYLADVKGHYKQASGGIHYLVIPHFGTFRLRFKEAYNWNSEAFEMEPIFEFKPGPNETGSRGRPSSSWVDQWSGKPGRLSIRRGISIYVAYKSGLPLKKADMLLNHLLDAVKNLFRNKVTINWARRGTMRLNTTRRGKEIYSFFPSPGFKERLEIPPEPRHHIPKPEPEQSWSQEKGKGSGRYKSSKPPMPDGQKAAMKVSGCGCLTLPFLAALLSSWRVHGSEHLFQLGFLLGITFVVLLFKRILSHRG